MRLEQLVEAAAALTTVSAIPFEPRTRLGLANAVEVVRAARIAAMLAASHDIAGTLTEDVKRAILEELWDKVVAP